MNTDLALKAFIFGIVSAVSLPLGAITARYWRPRDREISFLMAFGGGALLAALTIDLVGNALDQGHFYTLAAGCLLGGLLFVVLNQAVNSQGGFLRKHSTTVHHLRREKAKHYRQMLKKLSRHHVLRQLPPEDIHALVPHMTSETFPAGSVLLESGQAADRFFIIDTGEVELIDEATGDKTGPLGNDDFVGVVSLLTGEQHEARAVALTDVQARVILKEDVDRLLEEFPETADAAKAIVYDRVAELRRRRIVLPAEARKWARRARKGIDRRTTVPTEKEIERGVSSHGGAPVAIWLGIFLDGIPESLVIGASLIHAHISFSLLAGLFLSNYPEALSSSAGMRQQGLPFQRIFWMWTSLMLFTGIGAVVGNIFFEEASPHLFAFVEGIAAGAMLTMVAETMLPEAYYKGGSITGFSTLLGFLAAIFFKTLE